MEIDKCANLQDFYQIIDPLLKEEKWKNVNIKDLELLIKLNLKLLVGQTENENSSKVLHDKLIQLSDRINENFTQAAAHNLAFEVQGLAQGIFSKPETKVDFTQSFIPAEIRQKILAELTPEGDKFFKENNITSGLKEPGLVSKNMQAIAKNTKRDWVNEEAVALGIYGCENAAEAIDFIIKNNLISANLQEFEVTDEDVLRLANACPNLQHISIYFAGISDKAIEHLKEMKKLTSVSFDNCLGITDKGLEHLKGMPLTSVNFSRCKKLTDKGLEHLRGMPLTSVNFSSCNLLTDDGIEHLKGMPLRSADFMWCDNLTDKSLEHLKGMPLASLNFYNCDKLTNQGLEHLKGMPLTSVKFSGCILLTDDGLEHLKGMSLRSAEFMDCYKLTDKCLEYFKGMPLEFLNFMNCHKVTKESLEPFKQILPN